MSTDQEPSRPSCQSNVDEGRSCGNYCKSRWYILSGSGTISFDPNSMGSESSIEMSLVQDAAIIATGQPDQKMILAIDMKVRTGLAKDTEAATVGAPADK